MNELWTIAQAADNLFVDRKRVYDWISRRHIIPRGLTSDGECLYSESDLLHAERSRRLSARWQRLLARAQPLEE